MLAHDQSSRSFSAISKGFVVSLTDLIKIPKYGRVLPWAILTKVTIMSICVHLIQSVRYHFSVDIIILFLFTKHISGTSPKTIKCEYGFDQKPQTYRDHGHPLRQQPLEHGYRLWLGKMVYCGPFSRLILIGPLFFKLYPIQH